MIIAIHNHFLFEAAHLDQLLFFGQKILALRVSIKARE